MLGLSTDRGPMRLGEDCNPSTRRITVLSGVGNLPTGYRRSPTLHQYAPSRVGKGARRRSRLGNVERLARSHRNVVRPISRSVLAQEAAAVEDRRRQRDRQDARHQPTCRRARAWVLLQPVGVSVGLQGRRDQGRSGRQPAGTVIERDAAHAEKLLEERWAIWRTTTGPE